MLSKLNLENRLSEIYQVLESEYATARQLGVLAGASGISMFFFHYAKYLEKNDPALLGNSLLEASLEKINEGYGMPTFCSGIAGLGWVFEHLEEEGFIEIENDELLVSLDDYLLESMRGFLVEKEYDYLHGAIGQGMYFLKRFKNTKSSALRATYEANLKELIAGLDQMAIQDEHGLKWRSILNIDTNEEGFNLSLSHGIASIVNFLSRLYTHPEFAAPCEPLLRGAISYLLAQESPHCGASLFPSTVQEPPGPMDESRLSWCYGDLGLGVSLLRAGEALGDETLREKGIDILRQAAPRKGVMENRVMDASPCHGAFGIAHIFGVAFKKTGMVLFKEAQDHWMKNGLKLGQHKDGHAGFRQFRADKGWSNEINLIEGVAGIGMVLISYLADFETTWDEVFLLN